MVHSIVSAFNTLGYRYENLIEDEEQALFRLGIRLNHALADAMVHVQYPRRLVTIYIKTVIIPENKRRQVAEYITRVNFGLKFGCLELDFSDGELRFRTSFIYNHQAPVPESDFIIYFETSLRVMDIYLPGVMAVVYANIDPYTAVCQVESVTNPNMN